MIASTQTNHPLAGALTPPTAQSRPLDAATSRLRAAGLRITQPRIAILETMIRFGQPASIDRIHAELSHASCDLVTVYRCLAAFEELGLVRRSFLPSGTCLYEINLGGDNRYHVICKNTHGVEQIDADSAAELRSTIARIEERLKARGYSEISHVVEFFGIAPQGGRVGTPPPPVQMPRDL